MGKWRKAFSAARVTDYLLAAGIALAVWLPLAAYVAYSHRTLSEALDREVASRADFHAQLLATAIDRTVTAAQLLPVALQASTPLEMKGILNRLATLGGMAGTFELALSDAPSGKIQIRSGDPESVLSSLPPLQPGTSLLLMGGPTWTAHSDELVFNQAVFIRKDAEEPKFWAYLSATLPFKSLIEASLLNQPKAAGLGVNLYYKSEATSTRTSVFDTRFDPAVQGTKKTIALPRDGELLLELQQSGGTLMYSPIVGWLAGLLLLLAIYGIALRILVHPRMDENELSRMLLCKEEERHALEQAIAHRVRTEALLERSHKMLDAMFEHLPGMVVIKRASDLRVTRVNRGCEILLDRGRDLVVGRNSEELYDPALAGRLTTHDYLAMAEPRVIELPLELVQMPGRPERWVRFRKVALFDRLGKPEYVLEFGEDETDRERLGMRLREHLNFLEQVIEAIPAPLFFKDTDGRFLSTNSAFEHFVGRSGSELKGKSVFDFAPRELAASYHKADLDLLSQGGCQIYEAALRGADENNRDVIFHKAVIQSTTGTANGIVGIILDITERKKAELRIKQLNRILTVLSKTSQAIVRINDRDQLLRMISQLISEHGGFPITWIYLSGDSGNSVILTAKEEHEEIAREMSEHLRDAGSCRETETIHCQSFTCCNLPLATELERLGMRSFINLPLGPRDSRLGGIGILGTELDALSTEEHRMLADLADNVSFALEAFAAGETRKLVEEKLELSSRVFNNSTEGIIITDARNKILMVNRSFSELTGYSSEEVIGKTPSLLSSGRQSAEFYASLWESLRKNGEWRGEIDNRRKNGEIFPEWLNISEVRNTEGTVTNYVAIFSDLTNRKKIEARLDFLAYYDPLTSLPNRTQLNERIHQALARPVRKSMALLVLDVDRFKLINDSLGHDAGDRILLAVAERLTAIVPDGACVCRLGGDEFAIFLDDLGKPDDAANVARNIQRALRHAIAFDSQDIHLSASIGISLSPQDGQTVDEITGSADTAMYAAMEGGGNTYRYFRQEMNSHSAERMRIESRLHSALERRELEVYYQPLVSAKTGQILGAEALLRWFNEDLGGFVSPATFIPLLEETGLIVPVGEWVIRTACKENRHWREATGNDFFVAVNLSAVQLADDQLINKISRILDDLDFPANCLEIELTESAMMRDSAKGVVALNQLKALGVSLSIDDFGTGYSSLSYLKQLPLDVLKIDRSFITEIPYLPESVSIVKAIVALGHSLQLDIIAEGVEELEQVEFLREAAVDILQGYHFSRPVPGAEFRRLIIELGRFPMPIIDGPTLQLASKKIA